MQKHCKICYEICEVSGSNFMSSWYSWSFLKEKKNLQTFLEGLRYKFLSKRKFNLGGIKCINKPDVVKNIKIERFKWTGHVDQLHDVLRKSLLQRSFSCSYKKIILAKLIHKTTRDKPNNIDFLNQDINTLSFRDRRQSLRIRMLGKNFRTEPMSTIHC